MGVEPTRHSVLCSAPALKAGGSTGHLTPPPIYNVDSYIKVFMQLRQDRNDRF